MTKTDVSDPWAGINKPVSGFSVLRVDPDHPHDFFWGKDTSGSFLLLFRIEETDCDYLRNKLIELKGVGTDIRVNQTTGQHFFILCLRNTESSDIFHHLCIDLIISTNKIIERHVALKILLTRLRRWKSFLSGRKSHLLSAQEVQGLFAELFFLDMCIRKSKKTAVAISGWQGPLDGTHDFVLGNSAVEVKSVSGSQKNTVKISSENQLITHLESLFLYVFFLAEFHDCREGQSLNQIVSTVREKIVDLDNRDLFENRLFESGYLELDYYDSPCYSVTQQKCFKVTDGFPRITPDNLPEGLANVSYDLILSSIGKYACQFKFDEG